MLVTEHLRNKVKESERNTVVQLIKTFSGAYYFKENENKYWNLMVFIPNSRVYLKVPNFSVALEAGRLFGRFFFMLNDFDSTRFIESISRFHDLKYRLEQYDEAVKNASEDRLFEAKYCIDILNKFKSEMHVLQQLKEDKELPIRVTHNDTKLSNGLFSQKGKGLAVIDLDTLMPGSVLYDFGDSVRTICSSTEEDEPNLDLVHFLPENFRTFSRGFLGECKTILTETETSKFVLASKYMIFIMGLRFLTDYLNQDIYFKTEYPAHNLVRAKNQFTLLVSMENQTETMHKIISEELIN